MKVRIKKTIPLGGLVYEEGREYDVPAAQAAKLTLAGAAEVLVDAELLVNGGLARLMAGGEAPINLADGVASNVQTNLTPTDTYAPSVNAVLAALGGLVSTTTLASALAGKADASALAAKADASALAGKADASALQAKADASALVTLAAALAAKLDKTALATINNQRIDQGGNISVVGTGNGDGGSPLAQSVAFTTTLDLSGFKSMGLKVMDGPLAFTADMLKAVESGEVRVTLVPNAVDEPTFPPDWIKLGSADYSQANLNILVVTAGLGISGEVVIQYGYITSQEFAVPPGLVGTITLGSPGGVTQALSWLAPTDGGSANNYDVRWSPRLANTWTVVNSAGAGLSTTVSGLSANTDTDFQVRANNGSVHGPWSASVHQNTGAAPLLGKLEVATLNNGSNIYNGVSGNFTTDALPAGEDKHTSPVLDFWSGFGGYKKKTVNQAKPHILTYTKVNAQDQYHVIGTHNWIVWDAADEASGHEFPGIGEWLLPINAQAEWGSTGTVALVGTGEVSVKLWVTQDNVNGTDDPDSPRPPSIAVRASLSDGQAVPVNISWGDGNFAGSVIEFRVKAGSANQTLTWELMYPAGHPEVVNNVFARLDAITVQEVV